MIGLTLKDIVILALLGLCLILFIVGFIQEIVSGIFDKNDGGDANERTVQPYERRGKGSNMPSIQVRKEQGSADRPID